MSSVRGLLSRFALVSKKLEFSGVSPSARVYQTSTSTISGAIWTCRRLVGTMIFSQKKSARFCFPNPLGVGHSSFPVDRGNTNRTSEEGAQTPWTIYMTILTQDSVKGPGLLHQTHTIHV